MQSPAGPNHKTAPTQLPMVGWYDPRLLAKTGVEVAISTIFGRHSDPRLVEALASGGSEYVDCSRGLPARLVRAGDKVDKQTPLPPEPETFCIDYVSDVGDGWNSTYAMAYQIALFHYAPREFKYSSNGKVQKVTLPKGSIMLFGGDEVYPTANREAYEKRLIEPYRTALGWTDPPHPNVLAIPGNHDWYDSLVAFRRLFGQNRWLGGWKALQSRSYYALKLPKKWWLLGTDVQLGSDIDRPQVEYFKWVSTHFQDDDRVILCNAEPHWISETLYHDVDSTYSETNLHFLEKTLGCKVSVFIAGDLHHYRRHASDDGVQKITAGGGGAFLHPTHSGVFGRRVDVLRSSSPMDHKKDAPQTFKLQKCFPSEKTSRRLCWLNLVFPYLKGNKSRNFGFVTGALYTLTTLAVLTAEKPVAHTWANVVGSAVSSVLSSSMSLLWVCLIFAGFIFFTDTPSKFHRIAMGGLHSIAHVLAAFSLALLSVLIVARIWPAGWVVEFNLGSYPIALHSHLGLAALLVFVLGFFVGPLVLGVYLLISLNLLGNHANEAFSSIAVQDWKHFLKLLINKDGELQIYPIGVERVPRRWKPKPAGQPGPELAPDDPRATEPILIEPPIVVK